MKLQAAVRGVLAPALISLGAGNAAGAVPELEWRTGYIECGQAQIRARAQCHPGAALCTSETLTFARRAGRAIVGVHAHRSHYRLNDLQVQALDYRATGWACLPGKHGGTYLAIVMSHVVPERCTACDYTRLYDLNGRLIAAELAFSASGAPRPDTAGARMIREIVRDPDARAYRAVYR